MRAGRFACDNLCPATTCADGASRVGSPQGPKWGGSKEPRVSRDQCALHASELHATDTHWGGCGVDSHALCGSRMDRVPDGTVKVW